MSLTAFQSRLGVGQGRLRTPHAISGEYAFVLGDDEPGRVFDLGAGDSTEVSQTVDLTDVALVRAILKLRVPASTPPGLTWEASILVDSTKLAHAGARRGRERLLTDLAANVSKLSGWHEVRLRLELVAE